LFETFAFSKDNRRLETEALQIVRPQAMVGRCRQLLFPKPEFIFADSSKECSKPDPNRQFQQEFRRLRLAAVSSLSWFAKTYRRRHPGGQRQRIS
jgi:hypothetical protein